MLFHKKKGNIRKKSKKKKPPTPATVDTIDPTLGKQEETKIQSIYLDATDFNRRAVDLGIVEEGYDAYTEYRVNYQKAKEGYSGERVPSEVLSVLRKYRPVIHQIEFENLDKFDPNIVKTLIVDKNKELEYLLTEQVAVRKDLEESAIVKEADNKLIGELEEKVLGFEEGEEESKYAINKLEEKVMNYKKEEDHLRNKITVLEKEKKSLKKERGAAKKESSKYKSLLGDEEEEEVEEESETPKDESGGGDVCPSCNSRVKPGWFLCPECKNPLS